MTGETTANSAYIGYSPCKKSINPAPPACASFSLFFFASNISANPEGFFFRFFSFSLSCRVRGAGEATGEGFEEDGAEGGLEDEAEEGTAGEGAVADGGLGFATAGGGSDGAGEAGADAGREAEREEAAEGSREGRAEEGGVGLTEEAGESKADAAGKVRFFSFASVGNDLERGCSACPDGFFSAVGWTDSFLRFSSTLLRFFTRSNCPFPVSPALAPSAASPVAVPSLLVLNPHAPQVAHRAPRSVQ